MNKTQCNGIVHVKEHMHEGHKVAAYDRRCGRHNYHDYMDFYPSDSDDIVYERERNSRNSKQKGNMLSDALATLLQLFWAIKDGDTLGYLQAINALVNSPFFQVFTDWIGQFGITPDMLDFKERAAEFLASEEGQAQLANALQSQTTYPINHNLSEIQQMELPQIKVDLGNTNDFLYQSDNVLFPNLSDLTPSTVGIPRSEKISQNIVINESVSSKYANMDDVIKLKGALSALGYYTPPQNASMSPYFDDGLGKAISMYQKDMGLPITGIIKPGAQEISSINTQLQMYPRGAVEAAMDAYKGSSLFNETINASPNQTLIFNGRSLALYENGKKVREWEGVSGAKGYQLPVLQGMKNKGPLPEGTYLARQDNYQTLSRKDDYIGTSSGLLNKLTFNGIKKRGTWPGGAVAWGEQRVWLQPAIDNNTFGRDNFSIHGGFSPGSAGCIDLTWQMPNFANWFLNNKKDIIVHVKY